MNIYKYDIVFQEVPDQISLAFYVCGCPLKCPGCHSPELWTEKTGSPLTVELLQQLLMEYKNKITCVLFLGGEWHAKDLISFLTLCQQQGLLTALYTGLDDVPSSLKDHLDFLKVGPWRAELGGLNSPTTNQKFIDLKTQQTLNHLFQR
ncbi:anaerobic ribonucleoside-triphosphate reductase activating protein [Bdellovibrio bacteriovorus]|uniref:Anaerobic ribonucleoside-triphosphate reductase activating protein n=1 Tax=Bdellovibrio bacteriovorus TaxID=959 RepID=A0A150WKL9_BDEBC|nr:anaerobic ribonucleoside-triphosphate reductase activating protein [Bdellovibrio bacteriovorus]KYG64520.1 anaerobic ribonucleoside-triphosphate reductase activating protein [Bdellovibrio bacteriovorus]